MLPDHQLSVHAAVTPSSHVTCTQARQTAAGGRLHADAGLPKVRCGDGECQRACEFVHLAKNFTPITKPSKSDRGDSEV